MNNLFAGSIENFREYSRFRDLKDFNNNIEMFLAIHKKEFTKTEFMLFRRLTKFAAKVAGVSNASIKAILKGVLLKDFKLGASESTFHRMRRKAVKLGILEAKTIHRKNGSQSTNLWIFKRFDGKDQLEIADELNTIDTPGIQVKPSETALHKEKEVKQLTPLKTVLSFKSNQKNINKRKATAFNATQPLDHSFVSNRVPAEFVTAIKPFFDDAKIIEEYWKMAVIDTRLIKRLHVDDDDILYTAIEAFKQMTRKLKIGGVKNPIAYYTGVFKNKIDILVQISTEETIRELELMES